MKDNIIQYNCFRYYDPKIGRYITSDPIGLDGGINLYAYVEGNPVNDIDPTGEGPMPGAAVGAFCEGSSLGGLYNTYDVLDA